MSTLEYDLIVIGAGPGGYVAAIRAAQLGMKVACIDKEKALGGTCLRVGCIPSKALLDSSEHYHQALHGLKVHGIQLSGVKLDLAAMLKRKDDVVSALTGGVAGLFKKHKIDSVCGVASFSENGTVEVSTEDGEQTLKADHIIIATGSAPIELPGLPFNGKDIVSSTEALDFAEAPERLLVVGGGFIGLELGSVWARLGSDVTVVELLGNIVPNMDEELGRLLKRALEKQGLQFKMSTKATGVENKKDGLHVQLETVDGQDTIVVDKVLVAASRKPYTEGLGLDQIGVLTDNRGRIPVNKRFETTAAGVYAIGDVIAGPMLAHKAEEDAIACVELMNGQAGHVNYDLVPSVVYTHPEMAAVGKTEAQCKEAGLSVNIGKFPFRANGRARAAEDTEGMVKVIAQANTDTLLGVHILGPRASDLIAECVAVMAFGGSAEDLARICHAHPTFPEAVKEAALDVGGRVIHI